MGDLDDEDYAFIASLISGSPSDGEKPDGNPRVGQNGGGFEEGETTDPDTPATGDV